MTASLWLRDLLSYSIQVAVIVGLGAALARLFAPRASAATAAYWQALLVACLLLPFCQPWKDAPAPSVLATRSEPAAPSPASPSPRADLSRAILIVLAAGSAGRGSWLALGLWNLRRLRRQSAPIPPGRLPAGLPGVRVDLYTSDRLAVPVALGLLRPAIILPPSVLDMDPEAQQAILCHELLHVQRHDWACSILEEGVRALLWFHPLIWWLVARIHLAREQAVDQGVIGLVPSRERYVAALLAVARARTRARLVPAPLLLRKGSLKKRVAEILKETTMTRRRLLSFLTISGAALLLATMAVVQRFPLEVRAGEPVVAGEPAKDGRPAAEKDEALMKELRQALEDPHATAEQKAQWKRQLEELHAKRSGVKSDKATPSERLERRMLELRKAIEDPATTPEQKAKWKQELAELEAKAKARQR